MRTILMTASVLVLCACSGQKDFPANWNLDAENSSLSFVTTKNGDFTETITFNTMSGQVNANGEASVLVPLISVNSEIPVRDERLQSILFEISEYPDLVVTANLDPDEMRSIKTGTPPVSSVIDATINLHGHKVTQNINVEVSRPKKDRIEVVNTTPIVIRAEDFGLKDGIDQLRDIAGLDSIAYTVPVSFNLSYVGQ